MSKSINAVLNTKQAMDIIIFEAKKLVAEKFDTTVEMVDFAITEKNENVMSILRKLVSQGVKQVAEAV
jgi:hypothetical protein